jgi:hypothetical protein
MPSTRLSVSERRTASNGRAQGHRPNENKISYGYRQRGVECAGNVLIIENVVTQRVAVSCIVWLDLFGRPNDYKEAGQSAGDDLTRNHVWGVARFRTSLRKINHETEG